MQTWIAPSPKLYHLRYGYPLLLVILTCTFMSLHAYSSDVNYTPVCLNDTTPGKATITQKKQIILSSEAPVKNAYVIDISHLAFSNEAAAVLFFNNYRDNLVQFDVDFKNGKAMMQLNHQYIMGAPWSVEKWNNYLAEKAKTVTN